MEWFKTYLTDRKQKVVLNNTESEIDCLYAGVPQGSVVDPYYFVLVLTTELTTQTVCVDFLQTIHLLDILVTIYKTCRT